MTVLQDANGFASTVPTRASACMHAHWVFGAKVYVSFFLLKKYNTRQNCTLLPSSPPHCVISSRLLLCNARGMARHDMTWHDILISSRRVTSYPQTSSHASAYILMIACMHADHILYVDEVRKRTRERHIRVNAHVRECMRITFTNSSLSSSSS